MKISTHCLIVVGLASLPCAPAPTRNPFPQPLEANEGVIKVQFVEFASLPVSGGEQPARMMLLENEPGTHRLFVNDMVGPLYTVSYDGNAVTLYLDVNAAEWGVGVQSENFEQGFQSFAFHPQFAQEGSRGYGKFYTYIDTSNMTPTADFTMAEKEHTHDTVLLEWTAKTPSAAAYDGGMPRELMRWAQPYANHNGGHVTFNPLATPSDADYGLLYLGAADGGRGGDPFKVGQNLKSAFGKILRIDPLGTNSTNGKYGIPESNPFAKNGANALGEIYAFGVRNAQRLFWDSKNGNMFMSEIGQNSIEEISPVTPGANLGWNVWEGSLRFQGREGVLPGESRTDPQMTYPVAEYDHTDPLLLPGIAAIGGFVYRHTAIPQLTGKLIFGDNPSGEIFYVNADDLPKGGPDAIRRVLFDDNGTSKTLLQLIQEKNTTQGEKPADRADLRFGEGPDGKTFILNKRDGTIRMLVPDGGQ